MAAAGNLSTGSTMQAYAITLPSDRTETCTPNILPCHILHNGPVNANRRYWDPQPLVSDDSPQKDTLVSHFRGRRLLGSAHALPSTVQGVLLRKTDQVVTDDSAKRQALQELALRRSDLDVEDYAAEEQAIQQASIDGDLVPQTVQLVESIATFDRLNVWGHDAVPQDAQDPFAKGIGEWLAFATALNSP